MVKLKSVLLLFLVVFLLFGAGCSKSTDTSSTTDNVNTANNNVNTGATSSQDDVSTTVDNSVVDNSNDVEIGELI